MSEHTEAQFLARYRREGRDMFFAHYLLQRRARILGAVIERDVLSPIFTPLLDWMARKW